MRRDGRWWLWVGLELRKAKNVGRADISATTIIIRGSVMICVSVDKERLGRKVEPFGNAVIVVQVQSPNLASHIRPFLRRNSTAGIVGVEGGDGFQQMVAWISPRFKVKGWRDSAQIFLSRRMIVRRSLLRHSAAAIVIHHYCFGFGFGSCVILLPILRRLDARHERVADQSCGGTR